MISEKKRVPHSTLLHGAGKYICGELIAKKGNEFIQIQIPSFQLGKYQKRELNSDRVSLVGRP